MVEATDLGPQPAVAAEPSQSGPLQSDIGTHHSQTADVDIIALQSRITKLEKRVQLQDQALLKEQAEIRRARAVQLAEDISPFTTMPLTIIVRKIRDHTVDDADLEFLASCQTTLKRNGDLDMRKLGFVKASDKFYIKAPNGSSLGCPSSCIISADWVREYISYEDDVHPFLNIIERKDEIAADERNRERRRARKIAERNAYLKGLVRRPFSWMT